MTEAVEKKRRLTPKQWAEAEVMWELGEATLSVLAEKYKISDQAVYQHMKRHGKVRASKAAAHKKKVEEEVSKAVLDDVSITAGRIRETKEDHYKMSAAIARMSFNEILLAKQNGVPVSTTMNNLKALETAMTVLLKARQERWAVLGLDKADYIDEEGLPELHISELTALEIEDLRNREFAEFGISDMPSDDDEGDESGSDIVEE
jgi:hypothetical protein